jgi:hypothetical protein
MHHLWVSEFANGCGLHSWLTDNKVTHATAAASSGPFTKHDTSIGIFSHNAVPLHAPKSFGT